MNTWKYVTKYGIWNMEHFWPYGWWVHPVCKKLKLRLSDGLLAGLAQGSEGKSRQ